MTDREMLMARKLFVALDDLYRLPTTYGDAFSATERIRKQALTVLNEARREYSNTIAQWTKIEVEGYDV